MATTSGVTFLNFYHPIDESLYEICVTWKHYHESAIMYTLNGDGSPEESEVTWTLELTAIDDEPVAPGTEIPEWITEDMIMQELDLNDYYDGDNK